MTASFGTAIAMLEVVLSAILGAYLQPPANQATRRGKPRGTAPQTARGRPANPALPPGEPPGAPGPPSRAHNRPGAKARPVPGNWPTLMPSVSPIRPRLASG